MLGARNLPVGHGVLSCVDGKRLPETDPDAAFPRLVRIHTPALWTTALRLTGSSSDAEDLVQEVFAQAWRAMRGWDDAQWAAVQPRAFLVTIALNTWRNGLRTASRRPRIQGQPDHNDPAEPTRGPDDLVADDDALARLVAALPQAYRPSIVLRCVVGLPYAEVATVLGAPVGTVKSQVSRGLSLLRKQLS